MKLFINLAYIDRFEGITSYWVQKHCPRQHNLNEVFYNETNQINYLTNFDNKFYEQILVRYNEKSVVIY